MAKCPELYDVAYSLGLFLKVLQCDSESEAALQGALGQETANMNYLYAMAEFYLKRNRLAEARKMAEKMVPAHGKFTSG